MRAISWTVVGLLLVAGCQPANVREAMPDAPIARTEGGSIAGERAGDIDSFRGIPYAAAPVAERRWAAPAAAPGWRGIKRATAFAPSCPQPPVPAPFGVDGPQSEDCLYLNVWAPKEARHGSLPVFVWIHGGAFVIGSGSQPIYDGAALAQRGMVVVTINYRLGALGFLNHRALAGQEGGSANFGLLDQIAALQWVGRNISAFGGDPGNVTIAGESAGGVSVQALMASPLARGLFQKAIIQSGGGLSAMADARGAMALGAGDAWAAGIGETANITAADLRRVPVEQILKARFIAFPSVDGTVLDRNPAEAFIQGTQARVPLLIGANSWEASLTILDDGLARMLLGREYDGLLQSYRALGLADATARDRLRTDLFFVQPARYLARLHAKSNPTWLYHFDWVPASMRAHQPGAAHGGELAYLFATPASVFTTWDDRDRSISNDMIDHWAHFVATGDPNASGSDVWKDARGGDYLRFQLSPRMASPSAHDQKVMDIVVAAAQPGITSTVTAEAPIRPE